MKEQGTRTQGSAGTSFDRGCTRSTEGRRIDADDEINCTKTFLHRINCTKTFPREINDTKTFLREIHCIKTFLREINCTKTLPS